MELKDVGKSNRLGRATKIDKEMETILVGLLIKLSDAGIGLTKCEILKLVQDYLKRIEKPGEEPLFKNGTPSDKWYRGFIESWKSILSPRMAQNLPINRAKGVNAETAEEFYKIVLKKRLNLKMNSVRFPPKIGGIMTKVVIAAIRAKRLQ